MSSVIPLTDTPEGAIRIVGILGGQSLDDTGSNGPPAGTGFKGEASQTLLAADAGTAVLWVGLGEEVDADGLRNAIGAAARVLAPGQPAVTSLHRIDVDGALEAVVTGFRLGAYRFQAYRSGEATPEPTLYLDGGVDETAAWRANVVADATLLAREWVNRPPADKAPEVLAQEMSQHLTDAGFGVEVWDEERIGAEQMGGLLGVAAGSQRGPRFLVAHRPVEGAPQLALVGKGIVFDSGGLSIKSPDNMETMKNDMAGAAAVVAAAGAIGRLESGTSVSVYVPLTDNMSGGLAMKPGDVLTARGGRTIEVLNTDAEGRLVLADALALAVESDPDLVVDVATLTGASRVALGDKIASVFASNETAREAVAAAAEAAGERVWPMPLPDDYRKLIDSTVADMKNTGGRYGGAITAALLLREFVGDTPWAHIDIAGPSWAREDGPLGPKGATGFGVASLVALAQTPEVFLPGGDRPGN